MTKQEAQSERKISVGDCLVFRDSRSKKEYTFLITRDLNDGCRFEMLVLFSPDDLFTGSKQMILNTESEVGIRSTIIKGQI